MKTEQSMFDAAIESSIIFSHAVREVAGSSGLLALLAQPASADEIEARMGFLPDRRPQLVCLLKLLADLGVLEISERDGTRRYRAVGGELPNVVDGTYQPHVEPIAEWYGAEYAGAIRRVNMEFLGSNLEFLRSTQHFARFNREYEDEWRAAMTSALYEQGRMWCAEELARYGSTFLDLACGLGQGAQRIAEYCAGPARLLGLDMSADFVELSGKLEFPPDATVNFAVHDLNTPLPQLPLAPFDGVMFNGSLHFIKDKRARLSEIWNALRPGGLLCLGQTFAPNGYADQAMREFYMSMLSEPVYIASWTELIDLVTELGYRVTREFHQGSYGYLFAQRPVEDDQSAPGHGAAR
jgi:SAM-dependent methyltransferase